MLTYCLLVSRCLVSCKGNYIFYKVNISREIFTLYFSVFLLHLKTLFKRPYCLTA